MFAHKDLEPHRVLEHIRQIYTDNYGDSDIEIIEHVLIDVVDLFNGKRQGYQKCDAEYHNLFHTMQTVPPFIEIIDGWNKSGQLPRISPDYFKCGTIAVLLHDTGYIKEKGDDEGTGAKYTFTHMQRSVDFADAYLKEAGVPDDKIAVILNAIRCSGVTLDIRIQFHSDEERIIGFALGTADLLGQMSSDDYIDKLFILYREFEESYRFVGVDFRLEKKPMLFKDADELIRNTPQFYEEVALARFKIMGSMEQYIKYRYGGARNPYLEAIERNISKIRKKWKE